MIVSVLVDTSSPARSVASSSCDSGLPCASVRLSMPTSRMSIAPSSPPPPSATGEMWLMPDSKDRILPHATPVPTTMRRREHHGNDDGSGGLASAQVTGGRGANRVAAAPACQTRLVWNRIVITGAGGLVGRVLAAEAGRRGHRRAGADFRRSGTSPTPTPRSDTSPRRRRGQLRGLHRGGRRRERARARPAPSTSTGAENVAQACARAGAGSSTSRPTTCSAVASTAAAAAVRHRRRHRPAQRVRPHQARRRTRGARRAARTPTSCAPPGSTRGDGCDFVAVMRRRPRRRHRRRRRRPGRVTDLRRDSSARCWRVADGATSPPVLHVGQRGAASRFEQARAVFELIGADPDAGSAR